MAASNIKSLDYRAYSPLPWAVWRAPEFADLCGFYNMACAAQCLAAWHETCSWR